MTHDMLLLDSRTDKKYLAINRALAFSRDTLDRIRQSLYAGLGEPERGMSPFIAVSGSFGRLEASANSDVDCMVVYPGKPRRMPKLFANASMPF